MAVMATQASAATGMPGWAARWPRAAMRSRATVAATVERLLGLELGAVTVLVDGVGG